MNRFFSVVLVFAILLALAPTTSAQSTKWSAEHQSVFAEGADYKAVFNIAFDRSFEGTGVGISGFALTTPTWGQFYAGPSYTLKLDGVTIAGAIGAGLETGNGGGARYAGKVRVITKDVFVIVIREQGSSGYWTKAVGTYKLSNVFRVGAWYQRNLGAGPYVEVHSGPAKIWANYLFDHGVKNTMVGITTSF